MFAGRETPILGTRGPTSVTRGPCTSTRGPKPPTEGPNLNYSSHNSKIYTLTTGHASLSLSDHFIRSTVSVGSVCIFVLCALHFCMGVNCFSPEKPNIIVHYATAKRLPKILHQCGLGLQSVITGLAATADKICFTDRVVKC